MTNMRLTPKQGECVSHEEKNYQKNHLSRSLSYNASFNERIERISI